MPRPKRSYDEINNKADDITSATNGIVDLTNPPISEPRDKKEKLVHDADADTDTDLNVTVQVKPSKIEVDLTEDDKDGNDDELNDADATTDIKIESKIKSSDDTADDDYGISSVDDADDSNDAGSDGDDISSGDAEGDEDDKDTDEVGEDAKDAEEGDYDEDKSYQIDSKKGVEEVKLGRRLRAFQMSSEIEDNLSNEDYVKIHRFILNIVFSSISRQKTFMGQADIVNEYMLQNGMVQTDDVKFLGIQCVSREHNRNRIKLLEGVKTAKSLREIMKKRHADYMPRQYYRDHYTTLEGLDWISSVKLAKTLADVIIAGEVNGFEINQAVAALERAAKLFPKIHQDFDPESKDKICVDICHESDFTSGFNDDVMTELKECCRLDKWLQKNKSKLPLNIYELAQPLPAQFKLLYANLNARVKAEDLFKSLSPL